MCFSLLLFLSRALINTPLNYIRLDFQTELFGIVIELFRIQAFRQARYVISLEHETRKRFRGQVQGQTLTSVSSMVIFSR